MKYIPIHVNREFLGYGEDVPIFKQTVCDKFECQKFIDRVPCGPELIVNDKGFKVCPRCTSSWGKA